MSTETLPAGFKRLVMVAGALLALPGLPLAVNLFCILPLLALGDGSGMGSKQYGVASLTLVLLTLVAGGAAYWQAYRSLQGKPSRPLRLPPLVPMVGVFGLALTIGWVILEGRILLSLFFPPFFILAAALPPLWAVAWFVPQMDSKDLSSPQGARLSSEQGGGISQPLQNPEILESQIQLTWRRGLLAFAGGATVSVFVAVVLEILFPLLVLSLIADLANTVMNGLETLFGALTSSDVAAALANPSFWYVFVQIVIIAPLAEEIAKPLVVLPLVKRLGQQETFWLGALAGAGFAALENIIYATAGFPIWAGILLVRALGGALHPLGAGLVALGWRDVLRGEPNAWGKWFLRFGMAVLVHAVWNGGSLLVITLGGAGFFGELPPEIDVLGISAAGTTLAFLLILGLAALWLGRAFGHGQAPTFARQTDPAESDFTPSDRSLALWALACLAAIVPAGIAGLKLWLR